MFSKLFFAFFLIPAVLTVNLTAVSPGGTVRLAVPGKIINLDPSQVSSYGERSVVRHVYETLVTIQTGAVVPRLAQVSSNSSWSSWQISLLSNITFHDGSVLTAADVKRSLRGINTELVSGWPFLNIRSIDVNGDSELTVRLKKPDSNFSRYLSLPQASVWKIHQDWPLPLGTGPFVLEELLSDRVTLTVYADYHGGRPPLNRLEYVFFTNGMSMLSMYSNRQIHMGALPVGEYIDIAGSLPPASSLTNVTTRNIVTFNINTEHPLFKEDIVRKGVRAALGRESFAVLLGGQLSEEVGWHPFATNFILLRHNGELAKRCLKDSRLPPSMSICYTSVFGSETLVFDKLASYLSAVGFTRIRTELISESDLAFRTSRLDYEFSGEIMYADIDLPDYYFTCQAIKNKRTRMPPRDAFFPLYCPSMNILYRSDILDFQITPDGIIDLSVAWWTRKQ